MTNDHAIEQRATALEKNWKTDPRWDGVARDYTGEDVVQAAGLVRRGAIARPGNVAEAVGHPQPRRLHQRARSALGGTGRPDGEGRLEGHLPLGMAGSRRREPRRIGLSGPVAVPGELGPSLVRRINNALTRADEIEWSEGGSPRDWFIPIVADAESGFGGPLNVVRADQGLHQAGAAAVHLEDQLSSEKKCGHMGGKVLVPTSQHVRTLASARLAADVMGVPTLIVARTDSLGGERCSRPTSTSVTASSSRANGHPRASTPCDNAMDAADLEGPRVRAVRRPRLVRDVDPGSRRGSAFAEAIHAEYPGQDARLQLLAIVQLEAPPRRRNDRSFQKELGAMGYRFQFITLAGSTPSTQRCSNCAKGYAERGMEAYVELQEAEFAMENAATRQPGTSERSARATSTR